MKKQTLNSEEIPVDGSLGLLAIGYKGIMAWRDARKNAGIDIVDIRKKEYEAQKVEFEAKKAEFEVKKAEAIAKQEADKEK